MHARQMVCTAEPACVVHMPADMLHVVLQDMQHRLAPSNSHALSCVCGVFDVCCAVLCLQGGDLIGNLITSAAEVPGLIFSLFMIHYCSRKLAFAVPMSIIPVALIPLIAGG